MARREPGASRTGSLRISVCDGLIWRRRLLAPAWTRRAMPDAAWPFFRWLVGLLAWKRLARGHGDSGHSSPRCAAHGLPADNIRWRRLRRCFKGCLASTGHRGRVDARGQRAGSATGLTRIADRPANAASRVQRTRHLRRRVLGTTFVVVGAGSYQWEAVVGAGTTTGGCRCIAVGGHAAWGCDPKRPIGRGATRLQVSGTVRASSAPLTGLGRIADVREARRRGVGCGGTWMTAVRVGELTLSTYPAIVPTTPARNGLP
jgi:hypothetical protein